MDTKQNNMLLVTSTWRGGKTFKMIPVTSDCPYNECIFDANEKSMAIISKERKENYHFLPKLNDYGDLQEAKPGKRPNGKPYAEQRVLMDTYYEYYLEDVEDIRAFVKNFATNADTFNFEEQLEAAFAPKPTMEQPVEA